MLPILVFFDLYYERFSVVLVLDRSIVRLNVLEERVWSSNRVDSSEVNDLIPELPDFNVPLKSKLLDRNLQFFHYSFHDIVTHSVYAKCGYVIQRSALKIYYNQPSLLPDYSGNLRSWINCQRASKSQTNVSTLPMIESILQHVFWKLLTKVYDGVIQLSFAFLTLSGRLMVKNTIS